MPKIERKDVEKAADAFDALCSRHKELFRRKNTQYGNTIVTTGVLGASIELIGAVMRLPALVLKDPKHGGSNVEALKDIFADIHNYSNIALMMLEDENWDGIL